MSTDMSFDAWIHDLEAVADAAGLERFALWGISGAPAVAIAYAVRHPERVSHLVLCGGFCRGRLRRDASPATVEKARVMLELIEQGWGTEEPAFRQVFTSLMVPGGTAEQWRWFTDMMRRATSPQTAQRMLRLWQDDRCERPRPAGALPDTGAACTARRDRAVRGRQADGVADPGRRVRHAG